MVKYPILRHRHQCSLASDILPQIRAGLVPSLYLFSAQTSPVRARYSRHLLEIAPRLLSLRRPCALRSVSCTNGGAPPVLDLATFVPSPAFLPGTARGGTRGLLNGVHSVLVHSLNVLKPLQAQYDHTGSVRKWRPSAVSRCKQHHTPQSGRTEKWTLHVIPSQGKEGCRSFLMGFSLYPWGWGKERNGGLVRGSATAGRGLGGLTWQEYKR